MWTMNHRIKSSEHYRSERAVNSEWRNVGIWYGMVWYEGIHYLRFSRMNEAYVRDFLLDVRTCTFCVINHWKRLTSSRTTDFPILSINLACPRPTCNKYHVHLAVLLLSENHTSIIAFMWHTFEGKIHTSGTALVHPASRYSKYNHYVHHPVSYRVYQLRQFRVDSRHYLESTSTGPIITYIFYPTTASNGILKLNHETCFHVNGVYEKAGLGLVIVGKWCSTSKYIQPYSVIETPELDILIGEETNVLSAVVLLLPPSPARSSSRDRYMVRGGTYVVQMDWTYYCNWDKKGSTWGRLK